MKVRRSTSRTLTLVLVLTALVVAGPLFAFQLIDSGAAEGLAALTFRDPSLYVGSGAVAIERAEQFPIRRAAWGRFVERYGPSSAWVDPRATGAREPVEIDLGAFAGSTVRLRFRFFSEADEGWGQAGWTIDDVSIVTPSPCAVADLIFADRFESGDTVRWTTSHP